jgi:hypothetical protein
MHVELGLFDDDFLLARGCFVVGDDARVESFSCFSLQHRLDGYAAEIVMTDFAEEIGLNTITIDMPVHESSDWESLELGKYTIAFRCRLEA